MLKFKAFSKLVLLIFILVFGFGIGAGMALAGRGDNAEGGAEKPMNYELGSSQEEVSSSINENVSGNLSGSSSENFLDNAEGQPETGVPVFSADEEETMKDPDSPLAQFFSRTAGSNFIPRDSTATFSYGGGGCIQRNSNTGDSWFSMDLQVPDGAILDFMRVYYYDNDVNYDINSELWAFDGAGGTTLIAQADSNGALGYSSTLSDMFNHTVDSINESLVIVASIQGGIGSNLKLCGVRVRYQYDLGSANYLPAVLNLTAP